MQKVDGAQGVARQQSRRILLVGVDGVFEIENDAVGSMQRGVNEIFRLAARNVEPRPPHAITGRRLRKRNPLWQHACVVAQPCSPGRGFNACRNYERQRSLIVDGDLRVLYAESFENFFSLPADGIAIVGFDPRFQFNRDAFSFTRLNPHLHIRANLWAAVARFACVPGLDFDAHTHERLLISGLGSRCQPQHILAKPAGSPPVAVSPERHPSSESCWLRPPR